MGQIAFVTASRARLSNVVRPGGKSSPFYNIFVQLDLAGLKEPAARALLTEPFGRARPALTRIEHWSWPAATPPFCRWPVLSCGKREG